MRKIRTILAFVAILATQQVFADDASSVLADSSGDHACGVVAKVCLAAGFVKTPSTTKGIWASCMKPIIMGQAVPGVTIDSAVAQSCRTYKINEFTSELNDLQKVQ